MVDKIVLWNWEWNTSSSEYRQKAATAKDLMTLFTQDEVVNIALILQKIPTGMVKEIIREISWKLTKITRENPFHKYLFNHIKYEKVDWKILITNHDFFDFCEIISRIFDIKFEESWWWIKITVSLKDLNK